jgi:outer membrane protein assembly factor BamB
MFLIKSGGITTVFETATGTSVGKPKRIGNATSFFASPVYGDNKIYIASENGHVLVLAAQPGYEVLAKANDMGESIVATPAIAEGSLFIRTRTCLYCVRQDG